MSNARIREKLLNVANKEKNPPSVCGTLTVTDELPEATDTFSKRSNVDLVPTTSNYLEDETESLKPEDLFKGFTWRIERFSETSKKELKSKVFEVGQTKWHILVYPQGCDVCNHLSLFLCVADYDKLLPGWSRFAQFTIAVINKDAKKSKYNDTLHRFCKKEHDWGWKKFMELSKILDGFTINDTLTIRAQVQVIRDTMERPFRCLDPLYRQELIRVYLSNVETICRRFIEQKQSEMAPFLNEMEKFKLLWDSLDSQTRKKIVMETEEAILKGIVKQFFNEKEVTTTLLMDALFCGCKQIDDMSRRWLEGNWDGDPPMVIVEHRSRRCFRLAKEVFHIMDRMANEQIEIPGSATDATESGSIRNQSGDDSSKESVARDERYLAELGYKTVEIFVVFHIFGEHIEATYKYAESLKRQEALLREEEEAEKLEEARRKTKAETEKAKRAKKQEKKKMRMEVEKKKKEKEEAERQRCEEQRKRETEEKKRKKEEKECVPLSPFDESSELGTSSQERTVVVTRQENVLPSETSKVERALPESKKEISESHSKIKRGSEPKRSSELPKPIEKKMDPSLLPVQPPSLEITVQRQKDEISKLRSKIYSLEKQLQEKDAKMLEMKRWIENLKKRERVLEAQLPERTQTGTQTIEPPSVSRSETARIIKGVNYASVAGRGTQTNAQRPKLQVQNPKSQSTEPLTSDGTQNEGRSHSSEDETCSDTTFADQSRRAFLSAEPSQISDTHETRSLSSFGTQWDHSGIETEGNGFYEAQRLVKGSESTTNGECRYPNGAHGSHSLAKTHITSTPYGCPHSGTVRANSVASSIPSREQNFYLPFHPCEETVGRSYSLDACVHLPDPDPFSNDFSYSDIAAFPFGLYPNAITVTSEYLSSQSMLPINVHAMQDGVRVNEGSAFDDFDFDFAHFSIIKDFLD